MPYISKTIRELVLSRPEITAKVAQRMVSDTIPQNAEMPAIQYWVISTVGQECLNGIVEATQTRIQIDCLALTRAESVELADMVRLQLQAYRGTVNGQQILAITMPGGEAHGIDRALMGTDQRRYVTSMDFMVWYRTTTAFA